jgi:hypothetical protein
LTEQPTALRVLYETNTADPKEVQLKELMLTRDEKATKALALNDELKNLQNDRFDLEKSILGALCHYSLLLNSATMLTLDSYEQK